MADSYWRDVIADVLEEAGVTVPKDVLDGLADVVERAHDNYGIFSGQDVASNNWYAAQESAITSAKAEARTLRDEVDRRYTARQVEDIRDEYRYTIRDLQDTIRNLRDDLRAARSGGRP